MNTLASFYHFARVFHAAVAGSKDTSKACSATVIWLMDVVALLESGRRVTLIGVSPFYFSSPLKGRERFYSLKIYLTVLAKLLDFSLEFFVGNIILKLN